MQVTSCRHIPAHLERVARGTTAVQQQLEFFIRRMSAPLNFFAQKGLLNGAPESPAATRQLTH